MTCNKKYVIQVWHMGSDDLADVLVEEIVCGNSEYHAEKVEKQKLEKLDLTYYTRIIERTIDKTA